MSGTRGSGPAPDLSRVELPKGSGVGGSVESRIAAALERIAAAMEKMALDGRHTQQFHTGPFQHDHTHGFGRCMPVPQSPHGA